MCESCNIFMASCIMHSHKDRLNFSQGMGITNMQTRTNITDNDTTTTVGTTLWCSDSLLTTPHSNHHNAITTQPHRRRPTTLRHCMCIWHAGPYLRTRAICWCVHLLIGASVERRKAEHVQMRSGRDPAEVHSLEVDLLHLPVLGGA